MIELIQNYFRELALSSPHWNFVWIYDPHQMNRVLTGLWMTVKLSLFCLVFSVIIGIFGAWAQGARSRLLRALVSGYVQFFRNTPPLLQLLFFYFALGQFTPSYSPDGWLEVPIISNVGWAIISLSFFAGAFNIEIFRAGVEAVPHSTREAAESLGMTRFQTYTNVVFPLALRISMPALSANLINLVKTTNQAFAIAVPELLYQSVSIWNDYPSAQNPTMLMLLVCYLGLVGFLSLGMGRWEKTLRIPGYGV
ncbi:amino acid ABC transporter permease [Pseudogemmobacter faecipullorum]|uniref:Amino acid ABC transporter permease n=1 Tax=Pseudogemmobacter faecipullorum TaxID=2755041 RepID=A0ABS8CM08_9RHOB|nr:amino acid ABC transporter permease [Pseudogemmobacter faecipullorum]MCB5410366.1 amino acid ABC transporter permease [Pseudogemmobacter faecipullorum]